MKSLNNKYTASILLNAEQRAVCFNKERKILPAMIRLKLHVINGIKMSGQPLIINDGVPSEPTVGRFVVLLTAAREGENLAEKLS